MSDPIIRCAKCNTLVDTGTWHEDFDARTRTITVDCHGEREEMVLGPDQLGDIKLLRQLASQEGLAFAQAAPTCKDLDDECSEVECKTSCWLYDPGRGMCPFLRAAPKV